MKNIYMQLIPGKQSEHFCCCIQIIAVTDLTTLWIFCCWIQGTIIPVSYFFAPCVLAWYWQQFLSLIILLQAVVLICCWLLHCHCWTQAFLCSWSHTKHCIVLSLRVLYYFCCWSQCNVSLSPVQNKFSHWTESYFCGCDLPQKLLMPFRV